MALHTHDIQKEIKGYMLVFGALLVLTIVTVILKYLHFPLGLAILVALLVATIKASLVACYFMHLISERKLIYYILVSVFIFFLFMIGFFYMGYFDLPQGTGYVS